MTTERRQYANITIIADPEGYSEVCWGYRIDIDGSEWCNGGYPSREQADEAARRRVGLLNRDGVIPAATIVM